VTAREIAKAVVDRDRTAAENLRLLHANRLLSDEMVRVKSHVADLEALCARQALRIAELEARPARRRVA
jgi:hypothetical protein